MVRNIKHGMKKKCQMYFDLIIITKNDIKLVLDHKQYKSFDINSLELKPTNYKFISAEIEIPSLNQKYTINLDKSFFTENNILYSKNFIIWFLKKYKNVIIDNNTDYNLNIIDDMINIINIDNKKYIIIKKNNYDVMEVTN